VVYVDSAGQSAHTLRFLLGFSASAKSSENDATGSEVGAAVQHATDCEIMFGVTVVMKNYSCVTRRENFGHKKEKMWGFVCFQSKMK